MTSWCKTVRDTATTTHATPTTAIAWRVTTEPKRHKQERRFPVAARVYKAANPPEHHEQADLEDGQGERCDEHATTKRGGRLKRETH